HHALHQQVDRLAGEDVARVLFPEQIIAVDADSAGSGRAAGWPGELEQLQVLRRGEETVSGRAKADVRRRRRNVAVAGNITINEWEVTGKRSTIATEPVVPVIADAALLRDAGNRLDVACVGVEAEVPVVEVHRLAVEAPDLAT